MFFTEKKKNVFNTAGTSHIRTNNERGCHYPKDWDSCNNEFYFCSQKMGWKLLKKVIISHLCEELNLTEKEDVSRFFKPTRIKKYRERLEALILTNLIQH